ncbi:MAG: ABC transporter permease [Desulfovibrio sp.]|nr:ABC transporter permease [Desulfovibrio sp.]
METDRTGQNVLRVSVGGLWRMGEDTTTQRTEIAYALREIEGGYVRRLILSASELGQWDSSLLVFLARLVRAARAREISVRLNLPDGLARLLSLAFAVPVAADTGQKKTDDSFLAAIGGRALDLVPDINSFLAFLWEFARSFHRLALGRAHMRMQDLLSAVYECGVAALPIISFTSLLFGLILAFVGAVQLTQFGAQVYVAGLVSIGMLRIMGAVMVGVVMAGRVGAAYAALTGAMQVNEEVDALQAAGVYPVDFLVLPRVLAMTAMTPLLILYADLMGIVGGFLVAVTLMGINPYEYLSTTIQMTSFIHVLVGLIYGTFFGIIIALSGCFYGMRCGRSAQAVGLATTTAVVHSIMGIIVATAVITVVASAFRV